MVVYNFFLISISKLQISLLFPYFTHLSLFVCKKYETLNIKNLGFVLFYNKIQHFLIYNQKNLSY